MVKNLPAVQETWVQSPGWEDPLEKGMAAHCSVLAWRVPRTGSLAGYGPWGHRESDTTDVTEYTAQSHRSGVRFQCHCLSELMLGLVNLSEFVSLLTVRIVIP